jgi:transmembrane sensor
LENSLDHIDDLIGKHLSGEASADESARLEQWISQSDNNRRYFNQFNLIFERAASVKALPDFNTDAAWNRMKSKLNSAPKGKVVQMKPLWQNLYLRIAASVIIIFGVAFFLYRSTNDAVSVAVQVVAEAKIEKDTLPDGSAVTLNKKTHLAYTYNRKEKEHRVKLQGEAYFDIKHNNEKKFIVEAEQVLIRDIGTSFNVKAYPGSNTIEVVVEEGEVQLYTESNEGIFVRAGGKGIYGKVAKTFSLDQPEPNAAAYKSRHFVFTDAELGTMIAALNHVYDKKIKIAPHLANCRLTVTFSDETPDEIANVIAETLGLSVVSDGPDILLEGKSCEN